MLEKSSEIFQRIEKKYVLSQNKYEQFRIMIEPFMDVDEYGLSKICNVYYDTDNFELIRHSNEKPKYKEKLRLRSYGVPQEDEKTFIEIKKKWQGVVYKRRIQLPLKEARSYLNQGIIPQSETNGQILNEIQYFLRYYRPVPKMYIAYDRIAMKGKWDPNLRLTLDFHIRYRQDDIDLVKGDAGDLLFDNDEVLLEVKAAGAYPLWLTDILSSLAIYPSSFSKYGKIYIRTQAQKEGMLCLQV